MPHAPDIGLPEGVKKTLWENFFYYLSYGFCYGLIVFIIVFVILFGATLVYPDLPIGMAISYAIGIDQSIEWGGVPVIALTSATFNGVVYGAVVWAIVQYLILITFNPT